MKKKLALMVFLAVALPESGQAQQFGWPPANYTVTGVRWCDGYHYRGLCGILRDRRCSCYGRQAWCPIHACHPVHTALSSMAGHSEELEMLSPDDEPAATSLPPQEVKDIPIPEREGRLPVEP